MKYFFLTHNGLEKKEVGIFPQSIKSVTIGDIQNDELIWNDRISKELILPEPILQSKAIPTTFLTVSSINSLIHLVLKKEFISFLSNFNIGDYQTWKIKVHQNKIVLDDYCMFYLCNPNKENIINFSNSVFELKNNIFSNENIGLITFTNYEQYLIKKKEFNYNSIFVLDKILYLDFSRFDVDLFRLMDLPMSGNGYYVSERLKKAIEEENFTGMAFKEIGEINNRIKVIY